MPNYSTTRRKNLQYNRKASRARVLGHTPCRQPPSGRKEPTRGARSIFQSPNTIHGEAQIGSGV